MRLFWIVLAVLLACSAYAAEVKIKDYPYFFVKDGLFNARYVVGEESSSLDTVTATILSTNLARFEDFQTAVGTSSLDSDIGNIFDVNAIVIGNPCVNRAARQLEGYFADCEEGLDDSTGYIKVFTHGNKVQVLITGLSEEDRQFVAEKLAVGDLDNLDSDVYIVNTGSGSMRGGNLRNFSAKGYSVVTPSPRVDGNISVLKTIDGQKAGEVALPFEYERIDIWQYREKKGFFEGLLGSIARFFSSLF